MGSRAAMLPALTWIILLGAMALFAKAAEPDDPCTLHEETRAFIEQVIPPGEKIQLVRAKPNSAGSAPHPVPAHCYLRPGDLLIASGDRTAIVKLSNRASARVDANNSLTIPEIPAPSSIWNRVVTNLLYIYKGDFDARDAYHIAHAHAAMTRDMKGMLVGGGIVLPGVTGPDQQKIAVGQTLILRWNGGQPPFQVSLKAADGAGESVMVQTAARSERLDLRSTAPGAYELRISGAAGAPLRIPVRLVRASDVPAPPDLDTEADDQARALAQAIWLLTRADASWRVGALSRLYGFASEGDLVAQSIVGMPDETQPHH
jgi:hypothetical protein